MKYSDDEMDEDEKDGREEVRVCVCVWRDGVRDHQPKKVKAQTW